MPRGGSGGQFTRLRSRGDQAVNQVGAQPIHPTGLFEEQPTIPLEHLASVAAYHDYIARLVTSSNGPVDHHASIVAHHADIARRVVSARTLWPGAHHGRQMSEDAYVNGAGGYVNGVGGYARSLHGFPDHLSEAGSSTWGEGLSTRRPSTESYGHVLY